MASPDVRKKAPAWMVGLGVSVGLVGVLVIGFYVWILLDGDEVAAPDDSSIHENAGLPSGFFDTPVKPTSPPEPKKEPLPIAPRVVEKTKIVKQFTLLSARDIFTSPSEADAETLRINRQRAAFNRKRRGAGVLLLEAGKIEYEKKITFKNTDTKFKGAERDIASFPVDLSRTITVDRNIPAILINAIQSDLAGKVVALVEQHVYGAHGKRVLIPAGSKAVGYYEPLKKVGEERLAIVWSRIITPQGININVSNAELADAMGRSGITGDVDNRNFDRFGAALLVSSLNFLAAIALPVDTEAQKAAVETLGKDSSQMAATILEEQLDIKPRVSIPAGSRILISPVVDIWFKKPIRNAVQVQKVNS